MRKRTYGAEKAEQWLPLGWKRDGLEMPQGNFSVVGNVLHLDEVGAMQMSAFVKELLTSGLCTSLNKNYISIKNYKNKGNCSKSILCQMLEAIRLRCLLTLGKIHPAD